MSIRKIFVLLVSIGLLSACSSSEEKQEFQAKTTSTIVTKEIPYMVGDKKMKGFLAIPAGEGPFPGVIVVHEWWGQTEYPRDRARKLAKAGYVGFAVDMYGEGKTFDHPKGAKAFSQKVMEDLDKAEENFRVALATLKAQKKVKPESIAALGYCFGGGIVLEMARRGIDIDMVASYHGNLTPIVKNEVTKFPARVLIFNGAKDPFVPKKAVETTRKKLKEANIRYKFFNIKNATHGFTNPEATAMGKKHDLPLAYNEKADKKSWEETLKAFKVVFK